MTKLEKIKKFIDEVVNGTEVVEVVEDVIETPEANETPEVEVETPENVVETPETPETPEVRLEDKILGLEEKINQLTETIANFKLEERVQEKLADVRKEMEEKQTILLSKIKEIADMPGDEGIKVSKTETQLKKEKEISKLEELRKYRN